MQLQWVPIGVYKCQDHGYGMPVFPFPFSDVFCATILVNTYWHSGRTAIMKKLLAW
jgi:hypothetical protein